MDKTINDQIGSDKVWKYLKEMVKLFRRKSVQTNDAFEVAASAHESRNLKRKKSLFVWLRNFSTCIFLHKTVTQNRSSVPERNLRSGRWQLTRERKKKAPFGMQIRMFLSQLAIGVGFCEANDDSENFWVLMKSTGSLLCVNVKHKRSGRPAIADTLGQWRLKAEFERSTEIIAQLYTFSVRVSCRWVTCQDCSSWKNIADRANHWRGRQIYSIFRGIYKPFYDLHSPKWLNEGIYNWALYPRYNHLCWVHRKDCCLIFYMNAPPFWLTQYLELIESSAKINHFHHLKWTAGFDCEETKTCCCFELAICCVSRESMIRGKLYVPFT